MSLNNQTVGNIGLYYVCYRLSLEGWNAMPTSRNARGVDVIAYNDDATQKLAIQVKALSKRSAVPMGTNLLHTYADYLVVCLHARRVPPSLPECYVLPAKLAKDKCVCNNSTEGKPCHWLEPRIYQADEFRENWQTLVSPTACEG